MPLEKTNFLIEITRPKVVRWALVAWTLFTGYDTLSNQLELPTLRRVFGMSGALLPWWGWLLVLQAILMAALFEYVRRYRISDHRGEFDSWQPLATDIQENASRLERLESDLSTLSSKVEKTPKPNDLVAMHLEHSEMDKKVRACVGSDIEDIESSVQELKQAVEGQRWSILAIYHRERMLALASLIDTLGDEIGCQLAARLSGSRSGRRASRDAGGIRAAGRHRRDRVDCGSVEVACGRSGSGRARPL